MRRRSGCQEGAHAARDGQAHRETDREADLPRELLQVQARYIKATCQKILHDFGGKMPQTWMNC